VFVLSQGGPDRSVDPGLLAFLNHGCNSKYNIGPVHEVNEMNADENNFPDTTPLDWEHIVHNPFVERNVRLLVHSMCYANRDIPAGSEIMDNFLNYADTLEEWRRTVLDLREQCNSRASPEVVETEPAQVSEEA